jgi:hypothetical protein
MNLVLVFLSLSSLTAGRWSKSVENLWHVTQNGRQMIRTGKGPLCLEDGGRSQWFYGTQPEGKPEETEDKEE